MSYEYGKSRGAQASAMKDELVQLEERKLAALLRVKRAEVAAAERAANEAEARYSREREIEAERASMFARTLPAPLYGGRSGLRAAANEIAAHNKRIVQGRKAQGVPNPNRIKYPATVLDRVA